MNTGVLPVPSYILALLMVWSLPWKGVGLWKAAKFEQKIWFIAILIINTFGILEIVYLFFFAQKKLKLKDLMFWKQLF